MRLIRELGRLYGLIGPQLKLPVRRYRGEVGE